MTIPRIVIAGTHSGCGKTTVAGGLMGTLVAKGYRVQPFKVGPDFIDPSHHARICGRESRNLDPYMMGDYGCLDTFLRASAGSDIAIIEGVMGMFDGVDGTDLASTAHVARLLHAPVVLVVDAKGMSRSIHALIRGFQMFDPTITLAGVIINRTGSPRHRAMIEPFLSLPAFGWIPRSDEISVKSRHLGLVMGHEPSPHREIAALVDEHCNLDEIVSAARAVPPLSAPAPGADPMEAPVARIGIAYDNAFCFYYKDNFDLLARSGAELVFFSPLSDPLPRVDAVYLGGGYPELFLPALASASCTKELHNAADDGLPILGECGGLMYLARDVSAEANHRMTGILPGSATMTQRIQALGYTKGTITSNSAFPQPGQPVTGHEFHYSRFDPDGDARFSLTLSRGKGICDGKDGLVSGNAVGQYTHAYFSPGFARSFVDAAVSFSRT